VDARPDPRPAVIRPVVPDDLAVLYRHQLDPESCRMAAFPPRDEPAFMAHWGRILQQPEVSAWAVLADDGAVAGNVVAFEIDGTPLVGYWIGREHWGRGLATRGLQALLQQLPRRPLYAHVARTNAGSIRVLEKCGFTLVDERTVTDEALGEAIDELVMELR
jgi:RimJ/RimL family protein N-acetyltransferase